MMIFWGDVWYNFKKNSDIYKKCFEPIDEQESCTDDSIKEIIRKVWIWSIWKYIQKFSMI